MQKYEQIADIIQKIKIITQAMRKKRAVSEVIYNIQDTLEEVNSILYHSKRLKFQKEYCLEDKEEYDEYINEIEKIVGLWEQTIQRYYGKAVDVEFWKIYEFFKYVDADAIYQMVVNHYMSLPEALRIEYLSLPYRYTFLQNGLDYSKGDFSLIKQHVEMMACNVEKYKWLYEHMADNRSKVILNGIISYWFEFNMNKLYPLCEMVFQDYYDLDILSCDKNEVLVDIGAFIGDSILDYINTYGEDNYKRIYVYEITPSTFEKLRKNISGYSNIITLQKGVSDKKGEMFINDTGNGAGNRLLKNGDIKIDVITLDEDINEPLSIIKVDIEGAEKDAIRGAKGHIRADKPKLLISSYHLPEDIFEIPYLINSIREDYKFFMRFNGHGCLWPCDYVLFAV